MKEFFSALLLTTILFFGFAIASKSVAGFTNATFGEAAMALTTR